MSQNHLDQDGCCSNSNSSSSQLKLYQYFMFCVPIFFTFILLFLFYLFYLRPRRVNWASLGMRTSSSQHHPYHDDISRVRFIILVFILLHFTFKPMIHFGLNFVKGIRSVFRFFFLFCIQMFIFFSTIC